MGGSVSTSRRKNIVLDALDTSFLMHAGKKKRSAFLIHCATRCDDVMKSSSHLTHHISSRSPSPNPARTPDACKWQRKSITLVDFVYIAFKAAWYPTNNRRRNPPPQAKLYHEHSQSGKLMGKGVRMYANSSECDTSSVTNGFRKWTWNGTKSPPSSKARLHGDCGKEGITTSDLVAYSSDIFQTFVQCCLAIEVTKVV